MAQAQSGTGKTAAFTLGMLSRIDASKKIPQVRYFSSQFAGNQLAHLTSGNLCLAHKRACAPDL